MARCSVASAALRSSRTGAAKNEMLWARGGGPGGGGAATGLGRAGADGGHGGRLGQGQDVGGQAGRGQAQAARRPGRQRLRPGPPSVSSPPAAGPGRAGSASRARAASGDSAAAPRPAPSPPFHDAPACGHQPCAPSHALTVFRDHAPPSPFGCRRACRGTAGPNGPAPRPPDPRHARVAHDARTPSRNGWPAQAAATTCASISAASRAIPSSRAWVARWLITRGMPPEELVEARPGRRPEDRLARARHREPVAHVGGGVVRSREGPGGSGRRCAGSRALYGGGAAAPPARAVPTSTTAIRLRSSSWKLVSSRISSKVGLPGMRCASSTISRAARPAPSRASSRSWI